MIEKDIKTVKDTIQLLLKEAESIQKHILNDKDLTLSVGRYTQAMAERHEQFTLQSLEVICAIHALKTIIGENTDLELLAIECTKKALSEVQRIRHELSN